MAGGTAFQPNAWQSTAFQIAGGVSATQFEATFTVLQDSDTVSLRVDLGADVTGGWPTYFPGRRKRRVEPEPVDLAVASRTIEEAQAKLEARRAIRRQEMRSKYVTEQIRSLLSEQESLKSSIAAAQQEIDMDLEGLALVLAMLE